MTRRIEFHGIRVNQWKPTRDCDLEPRRMREAVAMFNDNFGIDENHKYYIIASNKGYMLTGDLKKIRASIEHDHKIARDRLIQVNKRKKRLIYREKCRLHGVKHD